MRFNDSAQTIQTIPIFVKTALSVSDWGAKVFLVPAPDPHDCSLQLINRDYDGLPQCIVIRKSMIIELSSRNMLMSQFNVDALCPWNRKCFCHPQFLVMWHNIIITWSVAQIKTITLKRSIS